MEMINISSAKAVHERMDGHEELEGLEHAFALDLKDGSAYILYTDTDQEKVRNLSCHPTYTQDQILPGNLSISDRSNRWDLRHLLSILSVQFFSSLCNF